MSIDINISNYESYFLSYLDGELSEAELASLELFLQKHPQFRQELELLDGIKLIPDEKIVFENKAILYKTTLSETAADYDTLMLSYIDGELTAAEEKILQEYLQQQPNAQKELALLQAAKLTPDPALTFGNKSSLYRGTARQSQLAYRRIAWGAAAAAVIAGLIIWLLPEKAKVGVSLGVIAHHAASAPAPAVVIPGSSVQQKTIVGSTVRAIANTGIPARKEVTTTPANSFPAKANTVPTADADPIMPVNEQLIAPAVTSKTETPVIPSLPPQRNSMEEVVEQHLQQAGNMNVATVHPDAKKEAVLATSSTVSGNASANKVTTPAAAPSVHGELIMSVSGSDSKLLDKVTNVAKFFSRKRNKS
ncbi:hypothetical protein ACDQ55_04475 [Chitinophaga sp. 30R24]|uniref:hypothetical protein n=1 Tax=Chitinophaga sp. 30R24 TaxID=3248838 RepID=UPI003B900E82